MERKRANRRVGEREGQALAEEGGGVEGEGDHGALKACNCRHCSGLAFTRAEVSRWFVLNNTKQQIE